MLVFIHIIIQMALVARVLLRPHRKPASRIAWIVVIVALIGKQLGLEVHVLDRTMKFTTSFDRYSIIHKNLTGGLHDRGRTRYPAKAQSPEPCN